MGEHTFDGSISIEPPLNFAEMKKARMDARDMVISWYPNGKFPKWMGEQMNPANAGDFPIGAHLPLMLSVQEQTKHTDEGILNIQSANALVPSSESGGSLRHDMAKQVERLVRLFPEHAFYGTVTAIDEETLDAVKIVALDGKVTETKGTAYIHFEDGSQVKASDLL